MLKNTIIILLLFSISIASVVPRTAHAIPVLDLPDIAANVGKWILGQIEAQYKRALDKWFQYVWKVLLEEFKLKVLDILNEQIVSWITEGENEVAKFIGNWETYLGGAYKYGYNSVGGELRLSTMCGQFKDAIVNTNWEFSDQPATLNSLFVDKVNCSLDPLLANLGTTIQDYQKDFRNGGWIAYREQKMKLQNTYLGSYFLASDEAISRGRTKENAALQQGVASKGFIPVKRCIEDLAPGAAGPPNPNACAEFQITSPASVFESALDAATQGRFSYVINADQMVQMVLVVAESFANKLIKSGVDGLFNYGGGNTPSSGYVDNTSANDCLALDPTGELCRHQAGSGPTASGVPQDAKQDGGTCTANTDCFSTICGAGGVCISPVSNGSGCNENRECKSSLCGPTNTCIDTLANGAGCNQDYQCRTGYCSPSTNKCADVPPANEGLLGGPCKQPGSTCNSGARCNFSTFICVPVI